MLQAPLVQLSLTHFRNIQDLQLLPHPRFNFFHGDNAQGKTSLLEAIYFISELRSFRTSDLHPLIYQGEVEARLKADLRLQELPSDLQIRLSSESKQVLWNGKTPRPLRKIRRELPVILFTPDSTRLFRQSPSERRSYFDHYFGLFSDFYFQLCADYQHTLHQKSKLLDQIREGLSSTRAKELVEVWNQKLAELGAEITCQRKRMTREMDPSFHRYFDELSAGVWQAHLTYQPYFSEIAPIQNPKEMATLLLSEMNRRFKEEVERNRVLVGPHRDDWNLNLGNFSLKENGSQGQHRIAMAALKLAEVDQMIALEKTPMALFDDLLSELDIERSLRLLHLLAKVPCQVFLTSISPMGLSLKGLNGEIFKVCEGKIV